MGNNKSYEDYFFINWQELSPAQGVSEEEIENLQGYLAQRYLFSNNEARKIAEHYLNGTFFGLEDLILD